MIGKKFNKINESNDGEEEKSNNHGHGSHSKEMSEEEKIEARITELQKQ